MQRIDDLITGLSRDLGWDERLAQEKAKRIFVASIGEKTALAVTALTVRNRILHVKLDNAAARTDLSYRTSALLKEINAALGGPILESIRLS